MVDNARPLVWLHGEVKTPPFSKAARREAGFLFRMLQYGESLLDSDAVLILEVFSKKTGRTPKSVIEACIGRLKRYDELS